MKTITVRLNEEEVKAFGAYAELKGIPLSTLFKKTLEKNLKMNLIWLSSLHMKRAKRKKRLHMKK
ncbi:MAG TPA: DUF6290 family protein [Bacillota bacterium]|nr:DUF6290 family protein [Bacillota bacterium]